jgi:hypothetical protein
MIVAVCLSVDVSADLDVATPTTWTTNVVVFTVTEIAASTVRPTFVPVVILEPEIITVIFDAVILYAVILYAVILYAVIMMTVIMVIVAVVIVALAMDMIMSALRKFTPVLE